MMLSLSIVTLVAELISYRQFSMAKLSGDTQTGHSASPVFRALSKIEMPSILFFLGILMTVAGLESLGIIFNFGKSVQEAMPINLFIMLLGVGSAVIDNVPLVAASMGMFDVNTLNESGELIYAKDSPIWHFIAYSRQAMEARIISILLLTLLEDSS